MVDHTMNVYDFYVLSDKFKFIVCSFNEYDRQMANELINEYAINYSFEDLTALYEYCHNNNRGVYFIHYCQYEIIYIYAILNRMANIGINNIDRLSLNRLLYYVNDWWLRDGIAAAWNVLLDAYDREQHELEEANLYDNSLISDISIEDLKSSVDTLFSGNVEEGTISFSNRELEDFAFIEVTPSEESLPFFYDSDASAGF
ncbi:hypothetical protein EDI_135020 [Entamoeba dispar SAW760]|uniref:Uncharacterized protein n=1 Tax=Entamoeba dispar (strain ATCC PRA-260 / SAW760) TaxID=370354 RepID=B0EH34_ENTDS|nr:uncharacterized protein EDI_135020 [Entamoeba dispar SAW760]EDR26162.1 hypothetical protein EDI_135020 [Entamoeba dispar SAW760]|eukprot:EDR26162.1 hypothetical protein EDI_135020 [Entamoeba dispar SAW760]